eukprot:CAMPEP_0117484206 /NCGR_PEP_ID=MMETSP0784-20121206/14340_1 /TAXON_ID=39447 /ORGANISM="" /LENGTH=618 /DNA_ID=CAMNT_0005278775 /DNA_START=112 /DNA_END=1968 /DNA_ORIENTATION=+
MAKEPKAQKQTSELSWLKIAGCVFGAILSLLVFLTGLSLMGTAFKVLGGKGAGGMFGAVDNPISGIMTGILATVMVQSSSTSTSIVVAMVGEGSIGVKQGIPIIMGANIGTSVTNTIVSMGQSGDRIQLERAFAGATVHDMFNMLTVLTLLPIEAIIAAIQGEGGPLYWFTHAITSSLMDGEGGNELFSSPIKTLLAPIVDSILKANKYVIYALTLKVPEPQIPSEVNTTLCEPLRRLAASDRAEADVASSSTRSLLSPRSERRLSGDLEDCSTYYCISKDLDKQFKKISSSSYKKLNRCDDLILDDGGKPCGKSVCYLDAGEYYDKKVTNGALIKGGFLEDAGDTAGGIIGLILSILILCGGLAGLCKCLQIVFMGNARKVVRYATRLNDYVAMLIGVAITIVVQSSSVTTSALTPLCGIGVLPLEKMLPMTLGANIGTTCTALIASLVSLKFGAVQIALCHLFFNIIGILIWFPFPPMRQLPLSAAKLLGLYASYYRFFPGIYILVAFVALPGVCLGVGATMSASVGGGVVLMLFVLGLFGAFEFVWLVGYPVGDPLCYKVLSKEQREEGSRELERANAEVIGAESSEALGDAVQEPVSASAAESGQYQGVMVMSI